MPKYYKLITKTNIFYAILSDDGAITVGGKIKGCIFITPVKNNIAILERLSYDSRCDINGTMQRSYGTIGMIKSALQFAFLIHPELKEIQFQDHSYKNCGDKTIQLAPLYITIYGKTWYESKFGAVLKNKNMYNDINKYNIHVQTKPEWNILWSFIQQKIEQDDIIKINSIKKHIETYWTKTGSFREMIKSIINNNDCYLLIDWIEQYFTYYTRLSILHQKYTIYRYNENNIELESSEILDPYIKSLTSRQTKQQYKNTSLFMNFIPRKGGYRFGKEHLN